MAYDLYAVTSCLGTVSPLPAPTVTAATIDATGLVLTITFDMDITGDSGFTLTADAVGVALSNPQHPTTDSITFDCAQVYAGAATLLSYAASDVVNVGGLPLADFTDAAVTNNSAVSQPPTGPVFHSAAMDPATDIMTPVLVGDGPMTVGRDTDIWLPDYEGIYRQFGAGEVGWQGGRVTGPVGSRVVYGTDDQGDPLPETPWIVSAPQATTLCYISRDFTSGWSLGGGLTATYDQVGMGGELNTATRIEDASVAEFGFIRALGGQSVGFDLSLNTQPMCLIYYITKDSQGAIARNLGVNNMGIKRVWFNTQTGEAVLYGGAGVRFQVVDEGARWKVVIEIIKDGTSNSAAIDVYAAAGPWGGTFDVQSTGSMVIENIELYDETTLEEALTLPPIFTEGAAVSRSADINTVPTSNHDETNAAIYCEMVSGLGSALVAADNDLIVGNSAVTNQSALRRTRQVIGSATTGTAPQSVTGSMDHNGWRKVGLIYDNTTGKAMACVDGEWGTEVTDYSGVPITAMQIAVNISGTAAANGIRDLREYRGTYDGLQAIIDGLMA